MKRIFQKGIITFALCSLALCAACTRQSATKTLTGMDGKIELTVPSGWKVETDLNDAADIQASHRPSEMYVILLSENKQDLEDMTLAKHAKLTLEALTEKLESPEVIGPKKITVGGANALQYEVRGSRELTKIVYLHTTVETPNFYSQILAWTLPSRYEKNLPTLEKITDHFREVEGSSSKK